MSPGATALCESPPSAQSGAQSAAPHINCSLPLHRARIAYVPTSASKRSEKKKRKSPKIEVVTDPVEVAEDAGLRYVSDDQPGYTRKRKGRRFRVFRHGGQTDSRRNPLAAHPAARDSARLQGRLDLSLAERAHPGHGAAMRAAENNIATTSAGGRRATKTNTIACSFSARRCRKFAGG